MADLPNGEHLSEYPSASPATAEALTNAGQRKVHLIWEYTQSSVAFLIVIANIIVWLSSALRGSQTPETPPGLTDALFVIVGFYYGRTNHQSLSNSGTVKQPWVGR